MNRPWKALVILLGAQAAISAAAAMGDGCGACRAGGLSLGLVGFAFYAGLFTAALAMGPTRFLFGAVMLGTGVHVTLAAHLLLSGLTCALCMAATGVSIAMTALSIACDRANLGRLTFLLPWSALLAVGWTGTARPSTPSLPSAAEGDAVRVVVFTQSDCAYCDELRDRVIPQAEREFGSRLQVVYRPAGDLPAIRRTPTLVVAPARRERQARVIEGLPTYPMLRDAILAMEEKP